LVVEPQARGDLLHRGVSVHDVGRGPSDPAWTIPRVPATTW
jgi:hypothetical protein